MNVERAKAWSSQNWFLPAAALLAAMAFVFARSISWAEEGAGFEAALLFDVCVTMPLLYALCYGRSLPRWQLALRMIGLACLGIYLLSYLVPASAQVLLPSFGVARWVGIGVLIAFELWLLVTAIRLVLGSNVTAKEVQEKTGAPPFIARLMVMEARFWKAVYRFFRRR